jgi:hypothetical protein
LTFFAKKGGFFGGGPFFFFFFFFRFSVLILKFIFDKFDSKVDDGSDQDLDSHIMVWQIRRSPMTSSPTDEDPPAARMSPVQESTTVLKSPSVAAKTALKATQQETQKSPSFGQRMLKSISPSLAQKTFRSMASQSPVSTSTPRQKSTSPLTTSTSRSSSQASSVDTLNVTDHVSLAKEAFEEPTPGPSLDQTQSYLRWNQNVESMMNCPEPREDFTQLPVCTTPSFDRGLN